MTTPCPLRLELCLERHRSSRRQRDAQRDERRPSPLRLRGDPPARRRAPPPPDARDRGDVGAIPRELPRLSRAGGLRPLHGHRARPPRLLRHPVDPHGPRGRDRADGAPDALPRPQAARRPPPAARALDVPDLALRLCHGRGDLRDAVPPLPSRPDSDKVKRMSTPAARILVCALLLAVLLPVVLSACPLCKEEVPDNGPGMWRGMYWSILLMVAMPFAVAGTIAIKVVRARRRQTG